MSSTNEEAYEAIFEACEEGIIAVDRSGIIKIANHSALNLFGYSLDKLKDQPVELLIPTKHTLKHKEHREQYDQNPTPRKMGVGRDLMGLKSNGEEFPVEISLNQATINGIIHTVVFIIDISERKKIEAALKNSEEQLIVYATQLENRVFERTKELDLSVKKLEQEISERKKAQEKVIKALEKERELNELKSRFVSMASHEFRTPLATILSSASLIGRYTDSETQEKREKHIDKIKSAIGNLNGILNDFLSLAKLEEGKTDLNVGEVILESVAKEVIGELDSVLKAGQTIDLEIIGESRTFSSDEKIIKNIIINLLSNAIKYSSENAKTLLTLKFESDKILLSIKDEGFGIPEAEQQHLFERFFRAKNAINIQGTGLGLNIVKKYVEMLEGDITFESEENKGTTFHITLPL